MSFLITIVTFSIIGLVVGIICVYTDETVIHTFGKSRP